MRRCVIQQSPFSEDSFQSCPDKQIRRDLEMPAREETVNIHLEVILQKILFRIRKMDRCFINYTH